MKTSFSGLCISKLREKWDYQTGGTDLPFYSETVCLHESNRPFRTWWKPPQFHSPLQMSLTFGLVQQSLLKSRLIWTWVPDLLLSLWSKQSSFFEAISGNSIRRDHAEWKCDIITYLNKPRSSRNNSFPWRSLSVTTSISYWINISLA